MQTRTHEYLIYRHGSNSANQSLCDCAPVAIEKILESGRQTDQHLACVADALQVGSRVVPQPTPLHLALLDAVARSTTWR